MIYFVGVIWVLLVCFLADSCLLFGFVFAICYWLCCRWVVGLLLVRVVGSLYCGVECFGFYLFVYNLVIALPARFGFDGY